MLLVAILLAFVANPLIRIRSQRALIAEIQQSKSHRSITFADDRKNKRNTPLPGPWLARKILGDDAFRDIVAVHFEDGAVSDGVYPRLMNLEALESVHITGGTLTAADAGFLGRAPKLEYLSLETQVAPGALARLSGAKSLKCLDAYDKSLEDHVLRGIGSATTLERIDLYGTPVTGNGIAELGKIAALRHLDLGACSRIKDVDLGWTLKLKELEYLRLEETNIGDRSLKSIKGQRTIKQLDLGFTNITDAGVQHLREMQQLEELDFTCTSITDKAIASLVPLPNLTKLCLDRCTLLSDEATVSLAKMKQLRQLYLGSTRFTPRGLQRLRVLTELEELSLCSETSQETVEELRRLMPKCQIDADGGYLPWDGT